MNLLLPSYRSSVGATFSPSSCLPIHCSSFRPTLGLVGTPLPPLASRFRQEKAVLVVTLDDRPVKTSSNYLPARKPVIDVQKSNAFARTNTSSDVGHQLFSNNSRWNFNNNDSDAHYSKSHKHRGTGTKNDSQTSNCNCRKNSERFPKLKDIGETDKSKDINAYEYAKIWPTVQSPKQTNYDKKGTSSGLTVKNKNISHVPNSSVNNEMMVTLSDSDGSECEMISTSEKGHSSSKNYFFGNFTEVQRDRNAQQQKWKNMDSCSECIEKFHDLEPIESQISNTTLPNNITHDIAGEPSINGWLDQCLDSEVQGSYSAMGDNSYGAMDKTNKVSTPEHFSQTPLIVERDSGYSSPAATVSSSRIDCSKVPSLLESSQKNNTFQTCNPANSCAQCDYCCDEHSIDGDPDIYECIVEQRLTVSTRLMPKETLNKYHAYDATNFENICQQSYRSEMKNNLPDTDFNSMTLNGMKNTPKTTMNYTSSMLSSIGHNLKPNPTTLPRETTNFNSRQHNSHSIVKLMENIDNMNIAFTNSSPRADMDTSNIPAYEGNKLMKYSTADNETNIACESPETRKLTPNLKDKDLNTQFNTSDNNFFSEDTNESIANNYGVGDTGSLCTVDVQDGTGASRQGDECANNSVKDFVQALNMGTKIVNIEPKATETVKTSSIQMDEANHHNESNHSGNVPTQRSSEKPNNLDKKTEELTNGGRPKQPLRKRSGDNKRTSSDAPPPKRQKPVRLKKMASQPSSGENSAPRGEQGGHRRPTGRRRPSGPALKKPANTQLLKKAACGGGERRARRGGSSARGRRQLQREGAVWEMPDAAWPRRDWPISGMHERPVWPLPEHVHWPPPPASPTLTAQAAAFDAKWAAARNACDLRLHKALAGCFQVYKDVLQDDISPDRVRNCHCLKSVNEIHTEYYSYGYFEAEVWPVLKSKYYRFHGSKPSQTYLILQESGSQRNDSANNNNECLKNPSVLLDSCFQNPTLPDVLKTSLEQFISRENDASEPIRDEKESQMNCARRCGRNSCPGHSLLYEERAKIMKYINNFIKMTSPINSKIDKNGLVGKTKPLQNGVLKHERVLNEFVWVLNEFCAELCTFKRITRHDLSKYIDLQSFASVLLWIERNTCDAEVF